MDVFTDVDIFKEVVEASIRGIPVYILLDHIHFKSFLTMTTNLDIQIQKLRVSDLSFFPVHITLIDHAGTTDQFQKFSLSQLSVTIPNLFHTERL